MAKNKSDGLIVDLYSKIFGKKQSNSDDKLTKIEDEIDSVIKKNLNISNGSETGFADAISRIMGASHENQFKDSAKRSGTKDSTEFRKMIESLGINLSETQSRIDLYNSYRFIAKNIPQLGAALNVIAENILAPDEIYKDIVTIKPNNKLNLEIDNEITSNARIESMNINNILNQLNIEEKLFSWISNALLTGTSFIEIINSASVTNEFLQEDSSGLFITKNQNVIKYHLDRERDIKRQLLESVDARSDIVLETDLSNVKLTEKQFLETIISEDVFNIDMENSSLSSLIESHKKQEETRVAPSKEYRSKDFLTNTIDTGLTAKKNQRGRPTKDSEKKKEEIEGNDVVKANICSIILKHHKSEDVVKITSSGVVLAYIIIRRKEMNTNIQSKLFGALGNNLDLTREKNKSTADKMADIIIDKIISKCKSESNLKKSDLLTDDLKKSLAAVIMERKTADIRYVPVTHMIEFMNRSEYGYSDYGTSVLDSALIMAKYYLSLITSYTIFNITREFIYLSFNRYATLLVEKSAIDGMR